MGDTLKPVYNFLSGLIQSANYPTTNVIIELPKSCQTFVHHVGPLRAKIPVYSFRRPELDDWMRKLVKCETPDEEGTEASGRYVASVASTEAPAAVAAAGSTEGVEQEQSTVQGAPSSGDANAQSGQKGKLGTDGRE